MTVSMVVVRPGLPTRARFADTGFDSCDQIAGREEWT
jgi:hypothetical protein